MRKIAVEEAVGMVLGHDLTKIVPDTFKGAAFKKGHVLRKEDVEALRKMGKNHIWVLELAADELHENDAAIRIAKATVSEDFILEGPSEGKISILAKKKGLLKINTDLLEEVNNRERIMMATIRHHTVVEENKMVAGTRIIPLKIKEEEIKAVEALCHGQEPLLQMKELLRLKVGILVTGTEVYTGLIEDKFSQVLVDKVRQMGSEAMDPVFAPDEEEVIESKIGQLVREGAQLILLAGGMSVDADDVTPKAIANASTEIITYGAPVLPGAMLMLAYAEEIPMVGVPACAMYHKITVLDLVLQRLMVGEKPTKREISALGHGGLCQHCEVCHYPVCTLSR
ncbi:Probable molybdopterin binding domain-containing protein [Tindallia magadiensis]|uniref:Molybdopterin molybdenumtransferase n=1 Tax=Tindallia magadiensis TaxID=69895 RepID=A0A1I3ET12_9FIRM|nr:molybdopterin-binding protein [Tindallia magadiensis]SFI02088.1 Probable molybdopterin binding domain-containing protein [Tindallia magadiensis]